jgi:hypothetical protein
MTVVLTWFVVEINEDVLSLLPRIALCVCVCVCVCVCLKRLCSRVDQKFLLYSLRKDLITASIISWHQSGRRHRYFRQVLDRVQSTYGEDFRNSDHTAWNACRFNEW